MGALRARRIVRLLPCHPSERARSTRAFCEVIGASWRTGGGRVRTCALREHARHPRTLPLYLLLALNRNIENVSLPIDQQESKFGGLNRIGQSLKHGKVGNVLTIEFQHHVPGLETG